MSNSTEWGDSRRCQNCGALNDRSAEWCGQCHSKFPDAPPPDYETAVKRALRVGAAAERAERSAAPLNSPGSFADRAGSAPPVAASAGVLAPEKGTLDGDVSLTYKVETYTHGDNAPSSNAAQGLLSKVGETAAELGLLPMRSETDTSFSMAFKIEKGALTWNCSTCGNENAIRDDVCSLCGTPFKKVARHFADKATQRRQGMAALDTAGTLVSFSPVGLPLRLLGLVLTALARMFSRRRR
ncbi:MAG TPA: hypothetical protein VHJ82_01245 [Actinomycetota bacterium]|nr:hypothetical protein [Actinomycetota bacterium]